MVHTFWKNGLKVKMPIKLVEMINFYHCCELTTQNMKNKKELSELLEIRYKHNNTFGKIIIVIDKIPENVNIAHP